HPAEHRRPGLDRRVRERAAARELHRSELPRRGDEEMTANDVAERVRTRKVMSGDMPAFLAVPAGAPPTAAVIVTHERYGLTRHICELAERFAADGLVAIAPDLYFRHPDQAALQRGDVGCDVSDPDALAALEAVIEALARETSADPARLAAMGICQTARL